MQVVETAAPVGLGLAELEEALLLQVSCCCCTVSRQGMHSKAALLELQAGIRDSAEGSALHPLVAALQAPFAACRLTCWS